MCHAHYLPCFRRKIFVRFAWTFLNFLIVFCEGYYPKSTIKFWKIMEFWYKIHSSLTCSITSSRSSVTDVTSATSVCCIASFFLIRLAAVESSYLCSITSSQLLITIASFLTSFMSNCFGKTKLVSFLSSSMISFTKVSLSPSVRRQKWW